MADLEPRRLDYACGAVALLLALVGAIGGWWIYAAIMGVCGAGYVIRGSLHVY